MANGSYARAGAAQALGEGLGSFSRALMLIDESRRRADERQAAQVWREQQAAAEQARWEAGQEREERRHAEKMAAEASDFALRLREANVPVKDILPLVDARMPGASRALTTPGFRAALEAVAPEAKTPWGEMGLSQEAALDWEGQLAGARRKPEEQPKLPPGTPTFSQAFEAISLPSISEKRDFEGGATNKRYTRPVGQMMQEASDIAGGRLTGAGLDSLYAARAGEVGPPASLAQPAEVGPPASLAQPAEAVPTGGRLAGAIPGAAAPAVAAEPEVEVEAPTLDEDEIEELRSWLGQLGPDETRETMLEMGYSEEEVELVLGE